MQKRILITGSRNWDDEETIRTALTQTLWQGTGPFRDSNATPVLVSGACPTGADAIAEKCWRNWQLPIERHRADWGKYGRAAGPIRNQEMVKLGADVCLAFIKNESRGATNTVLLAQKAGIPTQIFRRNDRP